MNKEKSEYIAFPDDIKRATDWENYRKAIDLPFWMEALYDANTNYLALYGKDYEITKVTLCNLWEANSLVFGVIEAFRQIQSQMFDLWIID